MEHLFLITPLAIGIGVCIGIVLGERYQRRAVLDEMKDERFVLKEALKQIAETHNSLTTTQKLQGELMDDLNQKVTFMVQGIKGK